MITQVFPCHRRQPALAPSATAICLRDVRYPATVHVARGKEASADVVPMSFFAKNLRGVREMHVWRECIHFLPKLRFCTVDGEWTDSGRYSGHQKTVDFQQWTLNLSGRDM